MNKVLLSAWFFGMLMFSFLLGAQVQLQYPMRIYGGNAAIVLDLGMIAFWYVMLVVFVKGE